MQSISKFECKILNFIQRTQPTSFDKVERRFKKFKKAHMDELVNRQLIYAMPYSSISYGTINPFIFTLSPEGYVALTTFVYERNYNILLRFVDIGAGIAIGFIVGLLLQWTVRIL